MMRHRETRPSLRTENPHQNVTTSEVGRVLDARYLVRDGQNIVAAHVMRSCEVIKDVGDAGELASHTEFARVLSLSKRLVRMCSCRVLRISEAFRRLPRHDMVSHDEGWTTVSDSVGKDIPRLPVII